MITYIWYEIEVRMHRVIRISEVSLFLLREKQTVLQVDYKRWVIYAIANKDQCTIEKDLSLFLIVLTPIIFVEDAI